MQIPQIRMQSQTAKIAIRTRPAIQSIQQPKANLQIKQPRAEMNIHVTPGRLTIDQSQAWEEMGLKSNFRFLKEKAQDGQRAAMQGVARIVSEGDEMLMIHTGRNAFVDQAKRHANPPPADVNITWVPSPFSVKTEYTPGKTDIQFQAKRPSIHAQSQKPIISYQPGNVQISLKQHNSLHIDLIK